MKVRTPQFTGRHAASILIAFFAVVIAVNLFMARMASSTFGGVVVENSYVASQHYNAWLDEARAEAALGWSVAATRLSDGRVELKLAGAGNIPTGVTAVARHPLGHLPDRALHFVRGADGRYRSSELLAPGRWRLRIKARAGEQRWRQELDLQ
jgi:nitrogen fixation protein FixH